MLLNCPGGFGYTKIRGLFLRTRMSLGIVFFELCMVLQRQLDGQCSASDIRFCVSLLFSFFESRAILTDLSFFTVITTGLTNRSSGHSPKFMICLSCIILSSSNSTFSSKWSATMRPFCLLGIWLCLNMDFAMWFFVFHGLVHWWGYFLYSHFNLFFSVFAGRY